MNWYNLYRQAMPPLPVTIPDYSGYNLGAKFIDSYMSQDTADKETARNPDLKYLGDGTSALACSAPGNRVIKYVSDESDAKMAESLIGNKKYPVAKVFSVNLIQTYPPIWAIEMEKVRPYEEIDPSHNKWSTIKSDLYQKLSPIGLHWDLGFTNVGWNDNDQAVLLDLGTWL